MTVETTDYQAKAQGNNMPVSWKDCTEIGRFIQNDTVEKAKNKLEMVQEKEIEVPYTKYNNDVGHTSGSSTPGRYPVKAAKHVLQVLESAESNAENEGLNPDNLKVEEVITNQGREFRTPSRHQGTTKAAHVKIIIEEK